MNLHHFDPVTRIYTHTTQAPASPLEEGQFLSVAFATTSQLPTIPAGHIVKRTGTSAEGDGWQLIEDNRGNVWDTTTKTQTTHTELGPLPAGLTQRQPNTFDSWNGSEWAYDVTLEIAATLPTVIAAVNAACKAGIEAGFTSDALGETHSYESELEDQLNLSGNIQRAKDVPQKCRNSLGIVDYRMHTPTQIHQVGEDLAVHKMAHLLKAKTLKDSAQAAADANDLATLQSIAWQPLLGVVIYPQYPLFFQSHLPYPPSLSPCIACKYTPTYCPIATCTDIIATGQTAQQLTAGEQPC